MSNALHSLVAAERDTLKTENTETKQERDDAIACLRELRAARAAVVQAEDELRELYRERDARLAAGKLAHVEARAALAAHIEPATIAARREVIVAALDHLAKSAA